jgi:hypothetical protein
LFGDGLASTFGDDELLDGLGGVAELDGDGLDGVDEGAVTAAGAAGTVDMESPGWVIVEDI